MVEGDFEDSSGIYISTLDPDIPDSSYCYEVWLNGLKVTLSWKHIA